MAEKRNVLDRLKADIRRNATTGKFDSIFFVKGAGDKKRVRFLNDADEGIAIEFHSKWGTSASEYNHPCLEQYNKKCPHCDDEDPRNKTYAMYAWNVWSYDDNKVMLFLYKANNASPIPGITAIYEEYDTICDCDLVITRENVGTKTSYTVVSTREKPFEKEAKPFTKKQIMDIIYKAYDDYGKDYEPEVDDEDEQEDVEVKPAKKQSKKPKSKLITEEQEEELDKLFSDSEDDEEEVKEETLPWDEEDEEEEELPAPKKRGKK